MKKQYQNPNTLTMSFAVNDIVMSATLNNSVASTESIQTEIEGVGPGAPKMP